MNKTLIIEFLKKRWHLILLCLIVLLIASILGGAVWGMAVSVVALIINGLVSYVKCNKEIAKENERLAKELRDTRERVTELVDINGKNVAARNKLTEELAQWVGRHAELPRRQNETRGGEIGAWFAKHEWYSPGGWGTTAKTSWIVQSDEVGTLVEYSPIVFEAHLKDMLECDKTTRNFTEAVDALYGLVRNAIMMHSSFAGALRTVKGKRACEVRDHLVLQALEFAADIVELDRKRALGMLAVYDDSRAQHACPVRRLFASLTPELLRDAAHYQPENYDRIVARLPNEIAGLLAKQRGFGKPEERPADPA